MSKKKGLIIFFTCILAFVIGFIFVATSVCFSLIKPVTNEQTELVEELRVPQGMTIRQVADELKSKNLIRSSDALYYAARFNLFDRSSNFNLKSGLYTVKSSMSLKQIYELLQTGSPESIKLSIPEGLTITKTAKLLQESNLCDSSDFIACCYQEDLLQEYKIPFSSFEGFLFPDTYFFTPNMSAEQILRKLVDNFFVKVSSIDSLKNKNLEQIKDVIVLASIVEREYRASDEAPIIASVFTNRINNNIGLYSCATIEYILTEIQGRPHPERITYDDLKIDNPYNTYKWAKLPPGPISNPGLVALEASANPATTDYFYFVLTNPQEGRHTFSKSFDQHIKAENLYTKK